MRSACRAMPCHLTDCMWLAALQLKLASAASSVREKLPMYVPVPPAELNGHAMNGRHFGEGSIARTSPRGSLK